MAKNVLLFNKGHFKVKLGKLRLAVTARIFVPKTFRNLKIFFQTRHHKKLLVLLGRLRQPVKLAFVKP